MQNLFGGYSSQPDKSWGPDSVESPGPRTTLQDATRDCSATVILEFADRQSGKSVLTKVQRISLDPGFNVSLLLFSLSTLLTVPTCQCPQVKLGIIAQVKAFPAGRVTLYIASFYHDLESGRVLKLRLPHSSLLFDSNIHTNLPPLHLPLGPFLNKDLPEAFTNQSGQMVVIDDQDLRQMIKGAVDFAVYQNFQGLMSTDHEMLEGSSPDPLDSLSPLEPVSQREERGDGSYNPAGGNLRHDALHTDEESEGESEGAGAGAGDGELGGGR